ncbi:hypothetical protein BS50DRAFT_587304 [Corynespora cassiicola Philippines]|uniref:Uncharacterized protein n=1 Tax=Corynespora cassiicola Philippines TaxID=1448308 RepID=A0A2T2NRS4_CORCC|nr:hypothetical protein BS50DRAFT_587304 [Corynespora cassiicola Philippines]
MTVASQPRLFVTRLYSTMSHTVSAVYAEKVSGQTLVPRYFNNGSPGTATKENNLYRLRLGSIFGDFVLHENASHQAGAHYWSATYCADIFVQAGLISSQQDVLNLMNQIGLKRGSSSLTGQGLADETLGRDLHTRYNTRYLNGTSQQAVIIALLACHASFAAERGWMLINRVLVTGAWPWLGGYTKDYAKTIAAIMVCLFSCVRHGHTESDVGPLIERLASKLVDSEKFGCTGVRVRTGNALVGDKILFEPANKKKKREDGGEGKNVNKGDEPDMSKDQNKPLEVESPSRWKCSTLLVPEPVQASSKIITGAVCNHGQDLRFTGRIKLASSLVELNDACSPKPEMHGTGLSLVVAQTFHNTHALQEAEGFVRQSRILSVKRGENQCTGCAVKLAHLVGALIVIT